MMAHLLPSRVNFYTNNFSEQTVGSSFQKPSSKVVEQVARINMWLWILPPAASVAVTQQSFIREIWNLAQSFWTEMVLHNSSSI